MIKVPIPNRPNNTIWQSEDGKRCYLTISTKQRHAKWNGKLPAYMFTGDFTSDYHELSPFWKLAEYLRSVHGFAVCGDGLPYDKRKDKKDISLARILCGFYHGVDIDKTDNIHVKMVSSSEVVVNGLTDAEEIDFFKTHYVYNFTAGNLVSDIHSTEMCTNGNIFVSLPDMFVECDGISFHTAYDQELCGFLHEVPNWDVSSGALKTNIYIEDESKLKRSIFIPFSNIVVAHHRRLIPYKENNIRDKLKAIYSGITDKGFLVDHLSERPINNYLYLLALSDRSVNAAALNLRTRIKAPFFFYTVFDHARERCLVHLGIEGTGWEKYIVFGSLTEPESCKLYLHCLYTFKGYAEAAGCLMDKPGEESLLYYWAEPERMGDKANPLNLLIAKPIDYFTRYSMAIFWGIPTILASNDTF